jgi:hypothetical protein
VEDKLDIVEKTDKYMEKNEDIQKKYVRSLTSLKDQTYKS